MKKIFIIYVLCFSISNDILGQLINKNVLIYASKNDFLVPHIETTIESMINKRNGIKVFSKVTNLNSILINSRADDLIRADIRNNFPNKNFEKHEIPLQDSIFRYFIGYDFFLLINENTFQDKIEFQLTLFEVASKSDSTFPIKNLIKPFSKNNFFLNINSPDYLNILEQGIKKLIPVANEATKFNVKLTGNLKNSTGNHFYAAVGDTVNICPTDIYDPDTELDKIKFNLLCWQQHKKLDKQGFGIIHGDSINKSIVFSAPGIYQIVVNCNDGALISISDTFNIEAVYVPKIFTVQKTINLIEYHNYRNQLTNVVLPIFVKDHYDDSLSFFVKYSKKILKDNEEDSLLNFYKGHVEDAVLGKSNSNYYRCDCPIDLKSQPKITMKDSQLYLISIANKVRDWDEKIEINGSYKGLKTNTATVIFKKYIYSSTEMKFGIDHYSVEFDSTKCPSCGPKYHPSTTFKVYTFTSKKYFTRDLAIEFDFGFIEYNRSRRDTTLHVYPGGTLLGLTWAYTLNYDLGKKSIVSIDGLLGYKLSYFEYRTDSLVYGHVYNGIMGGIRFQFTPLNLRGVQFYVQFGFLNKITRSYIRGPSFVGVGVAYRSMIK